MSRNDLRTVHHRNSGPTRPALILGATALLAGFGGPTPGAASVQLQTRDSAGVSVITHSRESLERVASISFENAPAFQLRSADGTGEFRFRAVRDAHRLANGDFVIVDQSGVHVTDETGDLVQVFGQRGNGSGESVSPDLAAPLSSSGVVVWDRRRGRLAWFHGDGTLDASVPFVRQSIVQLWTSQDGSVSGVNDEPAPTPTKHGTHMQRNTAHLLRIQRDGSVDSLAELPGTEWELHIDERGMRIRNGWYFRRLHLAPSPEGLWMTDGTAWEVRRHDLQTGALDRIVRFDVPLERFTDADITEMQNRQLAAAHPVARPAIAAVHGELDYPAMLPPIQEILVGGDGRLWIGRLEALAHTLPAGMGRVAAQWIVLDNQGQDVVGIVTLPPRRRLLHADGDGVLTVTADDLDNSCVEWWPFK